MSGFRLQAVSGRSPLDPFAWPLPGRVSPGSGVYYYYYYYVQLLLLLCSSSSSSSSSSTTTTTTTTTTSIISIIIGSRSRFGETRPPARSAAPAQQQQQRSPAYGQVASGGVVGIKSGLNQERSAHVQPLHSSIGNLTENGDGDFMGTGRSEDVRSGRPEAAGLQLQRGGAGREGGPAVARSGFEKCP